MFALLAVLATTLQLTAKDNQHYYTVTPGTRIVMTLSSNRTTGYQWKYIAPPGGSKVFKLVRHRYVAPKTGRVGAGGKEIWRFRALRPSPTMDLGFLYVRSSRPNKAAKQVDVAIRVHR